MPQGIRLRFVAMRPGVLFRAQARRAEFDVSEFSLSTYTILRERGDARFVAIPVFPSKMFRHRSIYINRNAGIRTPGDLRGKKVGVQEFQQTAGVWARGILQHEYGVGPTEIEWYVGAYGHRHRYESRVSLSLPPTIRIHTISGRTTLDRMLDRGELDAVIGAEAPPSFRHRSPNVGRLFEDYVVAEQTFYDRTRLFPIMHLVVIKQEIYEKHPWVARSLYDAFQEAKRIGAERLAFDATPYCSLPWLISHLDERASIMGRDPYAYGLRANRHTLASFLNLAREQGLLPGRTDPAALFVPELRDT